jgi:hypothetical protein
MTAAEQIQSWFKAYLAAPIVILMFLAFKIIKKTRFRRLSEIDIDSGKRELDLPAILAEERAEQAKWPMWKKIGRQFARQFARHLTIRTSQNAWYSFIGSIATDAGRLGWDWQRQEPLSIEALFCSNSVLSDTLQSRSLAHSSNY